MKIGFLFPGYGAQYVGMGKDLYDQSRTLQEFFEEASACLDLNFIKLCFASSDAEISQPMQAYLSLFLVQSALAELLKKAGVEPELIAGYGIGQFAGIFTAKGFSFPDGLYALKKYAQFYEEVMDDINGMVLRVTGLVKDDLVKKIEEQNAKTIVLAAENNDREFIVSGIADEMLTFKDELKAMKSVKVADINPAFGFHSHLMDPVVEQMSLYLGKVDFKDLKTPVVNNFSAQQMTSADHVKKAVVSQLFSPIKWENMLEHFSDFDTIIVVGPNKELIANVEKKYPEKDVVSFAQKDDLAEVKKRFPKAEFDIFDETIEKDA